MVSTSPPPVAPDGFTPPAEFDDYVIVRPLGGGRMGRVYLAEDSVLARPVAIKFIAGVPDLAARRRFLVEARVTARIQHPNVVSVYRVGEVADQPYLVSELIRGRSLAELPRPMPWGEVAVLAVGLARGLAAAHQRGVIHCDVKPANVMITDDGVPKLVDFGLARVSQERDAGRRELVGTPDYMAPEVWDGEPPTRRADVYSLGVVLFELCTGATPFAEVPAGELPATLRARAAPPVRERAPAVDARLAAIIDRCLTRDPERRYASGDELREALEQLARQRDAGATATGNPYRGLRPFEAAHRAMFFGRTAEVGSIVARLRTEAMVIVAGDSGVGKSSLVRAGVIPAIVDGELGADLVYTALTMVPGTRPLSTLAALLDEPALPEELGGDLSRLARALRRRAGAGGVVLFVDQLEEIVTLADPAQAAALASGLARLSDGVPGVRVVATARADFLSRLAGLPALGPELARLLYFVAPLPPERLREVIVGPAAAAGVRFASEAMVTSLVEATAAAGSGGLPLLSFALAALWEERAVEAGVIDESSLAAVGGVDGALARHADAVLGGLPPGGRQVARRLLVRLVTAAGTRARRRADELVTDAMGQGVLEALVRGRLLVIHDVDGEAPTHELAHEVLVTGWATLREWLELDVEGRAQHERVSAAAAEWQRLGRRADAGWRGRQLAGATALDPSTLTPLEADFVRASRRADRRRRWAGRVLVLGAIAIALAGFLGQRWRTQRRIDRLVADELAAAETSRTAAEAELATADQRAAEAYAAFDRAAELTGEAATTASTAAEATWQLALAARTQADRDFRAAAGHLEAALARDPTRRDVRDRLGDALYQRAVLAELGHDGSLRDELLARLPANDVGGHRRDRWAAPGVLVLTTPPAATVTLEPGGQRLPAGTTEVALAAGSYVVTADGVHAPVQITRGARTPLAIPPPPADLPPGFVYVPDGPVGFGAAGDEDLRRTFLMTVPLHTRPVASFLIAIDEVTIGDWLRFVEAQPPERQAALLPRAEATLGQAGPLALTRDRDGWRLSLRPTDVSYQVGWGEPVIYRGRREHERQDWRRFPVTAVSATDAEAYAAWLDATGAVPGARLCTELEWERAARGVDGRTTPTGAFLEPDDANIDSTHDRALLGPDEVGSHPRSTSVFGLHDVVGNAFEWTRAVNADDYVARGGSYFHDRLTAHLANRMVTVGSLRDSAVGVRLCATPRARRS